MSRTGRLLAGVAMIALTAQASSAAGPSPDEVAVKAKPIACAELTSETLGLANVTIASSS